MNNFSNAELLLGFYFILLALNLCLSISIYICLKWIIFLIINSQVFSYISPVLSHCAPLMFVLVQALAYIQMRCCCCLLTWFRLVCLVYFMTITDQHHPHPTDRLATQPPNHQTAEPGSSNYNTQPCLLCNNVKAHEALQALYCRYICIYRDMLRVCVCVCEYVCLCVCVCELV